ncbi:digalactosyldiacylglycerol synthase 1, chloroplastic [Mayamaea pseudoterrestris]|nr:digalactosyldiacylglycerol synthase 1, chloroplastic [Mayamaea pseudoterrestris]
MGNQPSATPLTDGSNSSSGSSQSSETSLGEVDETTIITKVAAAASSSLQLTSTSARSTTTAGCLSFCWTSTTRTNPPLLLVVNTKNDLDDDEDGEENESDFNVSSSSFCSPSEKGSNSPSTSFFRRSSSGSMSSLLLMDNDPLAYTPNELALRDDVIVAASDCALDKELWIVTTAALPWLTGTSVNPLLRAAHLALSNARNFPHRETTLVVPWLEDAQDRIALYGNEWQDSTPIEQEAYIRTWLVDNACLHVSSLQLKIHFYPARYHATLQSIFAMGDLCERLVVRDPEHSVCILEEPEHVNFYRAPGLVSWRSKFPHVVGVVHTNYKAYAANNIGGVVTAPLVGAMSSFMVRAYCDQVIKLSSVLQDYAVEKEVVCNVHGSRSAFLSAAEPTGNEVYFIGKMLWAKGLDKLLELQAYCKKKTGQYFAMSVYGSGPQMEEIKEAFLGQQRRHWNEDAAKSSSAYEALSKYYSYSVWSGFRQPLPVSFKGRKDHAALSSDYKIFVNPSVTEVLCTTTAEAVAMNKWVIVPDHASNDFFRDYPNVLLYKTNEEFLQLFQHAKAHAPKPLSDPLKHTLTWEAATTRFIEAAAVSERDAARRSRIGAKYDETIAKWHYKLGKGSTGDVLRKVMGGGPVADQYKYERRSQNNLEMMGTASPSTEVEAFVK